MARRPQAGNTPHFVKFRKVGGSFIVTVPVAMRRYRGWKEDDALELNWKGKTLEVVRVKPQCEEQAA